MSYALVTVRGSVRADLALPTDIPISEFMSDLLSECALPEDRMRYGAQWGLSLEGALPFHTQQTLESAGVLDGAILVLYPLNSRDIGPVPLSAQPSVPGRAPLGLTFRTRDDPDDASQ